MRRGRRNTLARRVVMAGLAAALLAVGCGKAATPITSTVTANHQAAAAHTTRDSTTRTTTTSSKSATTHTQAGSTNPATAARGSTARTSALPPVKLPWKSTLPISASVQPACVRPGGTVTLTVTTKPKAGIGFQAIYSDGKGGSQPPFGGGYGGNDKGFTDDGGVFTSTWVVSPKAPSGTGRVDVIAGWHRHWGYTGPAFAVADGSGHC